MRSRAPERGVSLIEALVMLALAGLVLSMLLPEIGRGAGADTARAVASQDTANLRRAEEQFRAALRSATLDPSMPPDAAVLRGDETMLQVTSTPRIGDIAQTATFRIEPRAEGGALILEVRARRETLAEWENDAAAFGYFADGAWRSAPGPARVEMVRLSIGSHPVWIEKLPRQPVVTSEAAIRQVEGGGNLDR